MKAKMICYTLGNVDYKTRSKFKREFFGYLEYREYKEDAGKNAIRNEWDTLNMFAKAYV